MLILRIAVSVGLLAFAFRKVDWAQLATALRNIDPVWVVLAAIVVAVQAVLGALRWKLIVESCAVAISVRTAVFFSLIATFFNQTLPATVGGDIARVWLLGRKAGDWKGSLFSVFIDRASGGAALAALVVLSLPFTLPMIPQEAGRLALSAIALGFLGGFVGLLFVGTLPWRWLDRWKATRQARAVATISRDLFFSPRGGVVTAASIVIHLLSALAIWCIARALSTPLSLWAAVILVPPVMLIAMIPISIAGWGVRESAMVAILAYAGVSDSAGFLISIIFGMCLFLLGMVGGLAWIFGGADGRPYSRARSVDFKQGGTTG